VAAPLLTWGSTAELSATEPRRVLPDDYHILPDGGTLQLHRNARGEVEELVFSSSEEWLLRSKDERSDWNRWPRLTSIHLVATDITAPMMAYIATLPGVEYLAITGESLIPGEALVPLARMKNLRTLELDDSGIGGAEIRPEHWRFLFGMTSLENASLYSPGLADATLFFSKPCRVETLHLLGVSAGTASNLRHLTKLNSVWLQNIEAPRVLLESLQNHRQLRELTLGRVDLQVADFERLTEMRGLVYLSLSVKTLRSTQFLSSLQQLEELSLDFDLLDLPRAGDESVPLKRLRKLRIMARADPGAESLRHVFGAPPSRR
jgi:hypothetical protein